MASAEHARDPAAPARRLRRDAQRNHDALLADTLEAHVDAAERALHLPDPWDGFAFYLEETCRLQAANRGLNDAMGMRFPHATAVEAARRRLYQLGGQLLERAQRAGRLRGDVTVED